MTIVLTASGFSSVPTELFSQVKELCRDVTEVSSVVKLSWQVESSYQGIQDFLDSREARTIIMEVSEQILAASGSTENLVIISFSTGSLLVEEALTVVHQSSNTPKITHIMLAPAINGSDWANLGVVMKLGLLALLGKGVVSKQFHQVWKVVFGFAGLQVLRSLFTEETIVDKLAKSFKELVLSKAPVNRHIFIGNRDTVVRDIPTNIQNAVYYRGDYTHSEVGRADPSALGQLYLLANGTEVAKGEVIRSQLRKDQPY